MGAKFPDFSTAVNSVEYTYHNIEHSFVMGGGILYRGFISPQTNEGNIIEIIIKDNGLVMSIEIGKNSLSDKSILYPFQKHILVCRLK